MHTCPFCEVKGHIDFLPQISSWTEKKYACRNCKTLISTKTTAGKVAEVSGIVMTAVILGKMLADPVSGLADLGESIIETFI